MSKLADHFDCPDAQSVHCFLLSDAGGHVSLTECYRSGYPQESHLRCRVPAARWHLLRSDVGYEFNRRLAEVKKPKGKWGKSETPLCNLFGKELLTLLWAVEMPDVTQDEVAIALRGWLGLKPEERWWLCTMTKAATGRADDVGIGWRKALRHALCFDPLMMRAAA